IKIIIGLLKTSSDITIDNLILDDTNLYEIRKRIGVVFDNLDNSFLCETVEDDIAFTLENLCYSKSSIHKRIDELSDMLDIKDILNKSSNELSGGEKFKAALACALVHNPKILIIDESLSLVDSYEKKNILKLLNKLNKNGLTIINITHDLCESYLSDRLIVLNDGQIILDGEPLKVMEYDKVFNRIGLELPFEIELSMKLKLYGLLEQNMTDIKEMVDVLWE
nr:ATP-binding cassette domain-containing protein [Bacilli bacterium]